MTNENGVTIIKLGEKVKLPETVYEAMDITSDRDTEIGQIIRQIEREGGYIADGLWKILARKDLTEKEKVYAAYRMSERAFKARHKGLSGFMSAFKIRD